MVDAATEITKRSTNRPQHAHVEARTEPPELRIEIESDDARICVREEAQVLEPGTGTLEAAALARLCAVLPESRLVTLQGTKPGKGKKHENQATVTVDKFSAVLDWRPEKPSGKTPADHEGAKSVQMNTQDLEKAIGLMLSCNTRQEKSKFWTSGAQVEVENESLRFTRTDGKVLSTGTVKTTGNKESWLKPNERIALDEAALRTLHKVLTVETTGRQIEVLVMHEKTDANHGTAFWRDGEGKWELQTRVHDTTRASKLQFAPWRGLANCVGTQRLVVDGGAFARALDRVGGISDRSDTAVRIVLEDNTLTVRSTGQVKTVDAKEEIECEYADERRSLMLNARKLTDFIYGTRTDGRLVLKLGTTERDILEATFESEPETIHWMAPVITQ